jgi:hypothetical protein
MYFKLQDIEPLLDYLENNLEVLYKKLDTACIYPLFLEEILKAEMEMLLKHLEVGVRLILVFDLCCFTFSCKQN